MTSEKINFAKLSIELNLKKLIETVKKVVNDGRPKDAKEIVKINLIDEHGIISSQINEITQTEVKEDLSALAEETLGKCIKIIAGQDL